MSELPDPHTAPELFDGVLTRRVMAWIVDTVIISVLIVMMAIAVAIVGIFTLGLLWIFMPFFLFFAVLLYYAATLGSPFRATVGMRIFDLVLTPTRYAPLDGWKVLIHPFVFWLSIWIFWPLLFIGLFTARRQLLHDIISGTLMLRRSPMERHWSDVTGASASY